MTSELEQVDVGDIIVSGVSAVDPDGYLRKVTSITNTGASVIFSTVPATLEESIQDGSAFLMDTLQPSKVVSITALPGVTMMPPKINEPLTFYFNVDDVVLYDEDGNPIEGEYVDQNNDSIINADDLIYGKNPTPDFYAGFYTSFRYKKWSVGFSLRGEFGKYMYNNIASTRGVYQNIPSSSYMQNLTSDYLESEFQTYQILSDYYIESASFVRMDNLSVGYDVGKVFNDNASLTVSAIVQNVFVVSPYSGLDPEIATGIDKSIYPRPRIFSISANLKL